MPVDRTHLADTPLAAFAGLLDRHLREGTRPHPQGCERWTNVAFAKLMPARDDDDEAGAAPTTVANWRKGKALPNAIEPILLVLFGPLRADGGAEREALRSAYDAARLAKDASLLREAQPEPDALVFVEAGARLTIAPPAASDIAAVADPAIARRHPNVVAKLRNLVDACGTRLGNQRAWRILPEAAAKALSAADVPTTELPGGLIDLYDHTVSLGSFINQDDALSLDRAAGDDPLDPDIRRALADCLGTLAPWLRSFPSVRSWDSARRDFLTRPELFEPVRASLDPARKFLAIAPQADVLSGEDAARAMVPLDTATRPGLQGEKAAYRGAGNARSLLLTVAALKGEEMSGSKSSGEARRALMAKLTDLLDRGAVEAAALADDLPDDLRAAVLNVLAQLGRRRNSDRGSAIVSRVGISVQASAAQAFNPPRTHLARWREPIPGLPEEACPEMITLNPDPPGNTFIMGAPEGEPDSADDERPQRQVTVAPFALGRCAVTLAQWDAANRAGAGLRVPLDEGWGRDNRPVINVSWEEARNYCAWLSKRVGVADAYRLPSEAEWEYACRAGTTTPFSFGATISPDQANYDGDHSFGAVVKGSYRRRTVPVGSLPANAWGLQEMHGNVWEWVEDAYGPYPDRATDARPPEHSDTAHRVLRGGAWNNLPRGLRSARRIRHFPGYRYYGTGFRVARTLL